MKLGGTFCLSISIISGIVLLTFGLLTILFFQPLVDSYIAGRLPLKKDTETFELWRKPPATPMLKVYFFNVTNAREYLDSPGTKLKLKEFGPYTYSEQWEKVEPIWHPNGTLSYKQNKIFQFEPEMSLGTEADRYVLPNVPMLSALGSLKNANRVSRKAVAAILDILGLQPFNDRSVKEMMWGYEDPLIKLGKTVLPEGKRVPFDEFGFFYNKNNTPGHVLTVFTGQKYLKDFARINVWDGKEMLPFWSTDDCNTIRGTDGTGFPSMLNENSTLYIFNPDLCRSIQLVYKESVKHQELPAFRFVPSESTFGDVDTYPNNTCYCPNGGCARRGTFNISVCQFDSPVFLSWPHFLHGDPTLLTDIEGLKPIPDRHQFYMDIQPKLGIPMQAKARVQINIQMSFVPDIPLATNFSDILIPVIWFEDGINELPESVTGLLRQAVFVPPIAEMALTYAFFVLGGILVLCSIVYVLRNAFTTKDKFVTTQAKVGDMEKSPNGVQNGNNHNYTNGSVELEDQKHTNGQNGKSKEKEQLESST